MGVDVSQPFIEASIMEAKEAGVQNVEFLAGDVQVMELPGTFDYVFSRMGVMFFANPVQAWRNIRSALDPGGRLCAVVWRNKIDNPWVHRAEQVVDQYLDEPEETDEPTCGPGPFSMQNADTVSEQLQIAGFEQPTFTRCDLPIKLGNDVDQAVRFNMSLGPAAEVIRLNGDDAEKIRPKLEGRSARCSSTTTAPTASSARLRPGWSARRSRARDRSAPLGDVLERVADGQPGKHAEPATLHRSR